MGDLDGLADVVGPHSAGAEFRADLALNGAVWFYHMQTHKRCLLLLFKVKEGATLAESEKQATAVGKKVATSLQALKIPTVDFLLSSSIEGL